MSARPILARPRTDFSYVSTRSLIASVAERGSRPNVRLLEELLARPTGWEPGLVAVLNLAVSGNEPAGSPASDPVWLAVIAGERRIPAAVPPLVRLLRSSDEAQDVALLAAAEALAKIGSPAVEAVAEVARSGEWWQRIWAYASLGWNADRRAGEALVSALGEEAPRRPGESMADIVASALVARGDPGVTPALMEAFRACHPAVRGELEEAIRDLNGPHEDRLIDRDWRLRYLMDPHYGRIDTDWPGTAVAFTEDDGTRPWLAEPSPPDCALEQILSRRRPLFGPRVTPEGDPLCRCCNARMWVSTGVRVCPATAMTVAWIQDRWLTRARDGLRLEDLFDVLELLEAEYHALHGGPRPPTPWDQDEVDAHTAVSWAWSGVEWLIEQGVQDVDTGIDTVRQEATKLVGLEVLANRRPEEAELRSLN